LLSVSASLGFVELRDGRYQLTPLGEDYLVESSPTYFGSQWQIPIGNDSLFTIGNVEKAVLTNSPQTYGGTEWMKSHEENSEVARSFARSMHSASMAAALAWPEKIDLANCQTMFDIGGGSGAHCIGVVGRWPKPKATVLDIAPACGVAREMAGKSGLEDRIATHAADMWNDRFPPGDGGGTTRRAGGRELALFRSSGSCTARGSAASTALRVTSHGSPLSLLYLLSHCGVGREGAVAFVSEREFG
jgi:hypothetical protein